MIDFTLFCSIEAYLHDLLRENPNRFRPARLPGMAFAEESSADDEAFCAMIDQCSAAAIRELMEQFAPGAPIQALLKARLQALKNAPVQAAALQKSEASQKQNSAFYDYLDDYVTRIKGYKSISDFYNYAGISRQRINKLKKSGSVVTREFALHLAAALELDFRAAGEFLENAGHNFKPITRRETIVAYVMRHQKYTFLQMEEILYLFNEKTFLEA